MSDYTTDVDTDKGRELDAAVAERVMGWRTSTISPNVWHSEAEHNSFHKDKFRPSGSIEAAMQVVEKMVADGWDVYLMNSDDFVEGQWECEFSGKPNGATYVRKSLPEAICRAALKALESNQS